MSYSVLDDWIKTIVVISNHQLFEKISDLLNFFFFFFFCGKRRSLRAPQFLKYASKSSNLHNDQPNILNVENRIFFENDKNTLPAKIERNELSTATKMNLRQRQSRGRKVR